MLTVEDVAALLKVAPYTVRRWLREGKLAGRRLGKSWRVLQSELEEFVHGTDRGEE